MAERKPGRFVHNVDAAINTSVPLVRTGIEFFVFRKWKRRKNQRLGSLLVNAAGIRWRSKSAKVSRRISWEVVRDWFED